MQIRKMIIIDFFTIKISEYVDFIPGVEYDSQKKDFADSDNP